ncbi:hypothetical protein BJY52DRAFT_1120821, partial [Lactarius psammicola]
DFSFLSPRAYVVTTLKDGGGIRISLFAQVSDARRDATPSHDAPELRAVRVHDDNGPPPRASARTARVHVFTLYHGPGSRQG